MKIIYKSLLFATLFISCTDQLQIMPENSVTFESGIKTEKDIQSLLGSLQFSIRNLAPFLPTRFAQYHSYYYSHGNPPFNKDAGLNTMATMPTTQWDRYYEIIHQANIPLKYIERTNLSRDKREYYMGQAYFYKAFAYWWIARIWGDAILIKDDVILDPIEKTSWSKIVDYAIENVEKAIDLLPEHNGIGELTGNNSGSKFVASKGGAYALLAELAAWKAGAAYLNNNEDYYDPQQYWTIAENACSKIITSNQYQMAANPEEVCEKVLVGNSAESILEIDVVNYWDEITSYNYNYFGTVRTAPHPALIQPINFSGLLQSDRFNSIDSTNFYFTQNDLRRKSFFYKIDSLAQTNILQGNVAPNKYRKMKFYTTGYEMGKPQGIFQNWVVWRLAGIYLLRAESRVRMGNIDGAIADLNVVRRRANATDYNTSEGDLRYAIFNEKCKKEFLFEPHSYWFDIIRNGYAGSELKRFGYDKLSPQDLRDGALFEGIRSYDFGQNPKLRQNVYWFKRFGF